MIAIRFVANRDAYMAEITNVNRAKISNICTSSLISIAAFLKILMSTE